MYIYVHIKLMLLWREKTTFQSFVMKCKSTTMPRPNITQYKVSLVVLKPKLDMGVAAILYCITLFKKVLNMWSSGFIKALIFKKYVSNQLKQWST